LPSPERYVAAFSRLQSRLSEGQLAMLRAHFHAPQRSLTARQLARAADYPSFQSANLQYGILGRLLREELPYDGPGQQSSSLAHFTKTTEDEWTWVLHEPVVQALRRLGWFGMAAEAGANAFSLPEEVVDQTFFEGAVKEVLVNSYERNAEARTACIARHGTKCKACGFDFERAYGSIGAGFIHVHHRVLVSSIGQSYRIDPVRDLVPVCANCHAMIHRRNPPYELSEIQDFIKAASTSRAQRAPQQPTM
jgi:predicted HNH restriction endonuclease